LDDDTASAAHPSAPILISFRFKFVSEQSLIASGIVSVRMKMPIV
jgi:hypothetical protein